MVVARIPFTKRALATTSNPTKCDKALRDERSVLERGGQDTILMCKDHGRGEVCRLLACLFADDSVVIRYQFEIDEIDENE